MTLMPMIPDPLPEPGPEGPDVPETPELAALRAVPIDPRTRRAAAAIAEQLQGRPRAFTAQSIAIEARIATCPNCQGIHHVQDCQEPRASIDLGRELCWLKWANHPLFIALLGKLTTRRMAYYADSYIAFVRTVRPDTDLTAGQVLAAWLRLIAEHEDDGPPPAAQRLRWAA